MRRRQCAASSMPTMGRRPATSSSASRLATQQDRRARRHDARGARRSRQQRHLAEERTARRGARARWALARSRRRGLRDTSSSPRATMYASAPSSPSWMTSWPARHGDHLERADEVAQRLLRQGAEERQRRHERQLASPTLRSYVARGGVEDLRRLGRERRSGEEGAERLEPLEVRQRRRRVRRLLEPRRALTEGGRHLIEMLVDVLARAPASRRWPRPRAAGCPRRSPDAHREARTPRWRPRCAPAARAAGT